MRRKYMERAYPALLAVFGCIFLTVTGSWRIYTEPFLDGGRKLWRMLDVKGYGEVSAGSDDQNPLLAGAAGDNGKDWRDNGEDNGEQPSAGLEGQEDGDGSGKHGDKAVYQDVEDDYFADAVFIGDSRTVGLYEYGGLEETSAFYASTGLTVHRLFTDKIVAVPGEKHKLTVEEELTGRQFAKVYLMIGINEMGTGTVESFLAKYAECVEHIEELQPDAIIYLQGIMRVTKERSEQGDYITNEGIDARNEGIAAMADNERVFYLDVNEAVCDETGALTADYTHDGVHLKARYIALWKDYLKSHAVAWEPAAPQ